MLVSVISCVDNERSMFSVNSNLVEKSIFLLQITVYSSIQYSTVYTQQIDRTYSYVFIFIYLFFSIYLELRANFQVSM